MNITTFKGYGVNARDVTVVLDRVTHFYSIEYNGNHGTCIVLDTNKEVLVEDWPSSVKMVLDQAKEKT